MRVLVVTGMYPTPDKPGFGIFVKEQVESLRAYGIDVDVLTFNEERGTKGYLKAAYAVHNKLSQKKYDLVHAHYGLAGMVGRLQIRCPLVITFHGSDLIGVVDRQYRYARFGSRTTIISKIAALSATRCIVVADILRSKLWFNSAITIPMGVDLSVFKPLPPAEAKAQLGFEDTVKRILFVAHPKNRIKRFDVALAAVQQLQDQGVGVELHPVFRVSHDQIPVYMNACDALVLTSMHEASPCVVKEALACNLPVVSVDVGDVAERIKGVDGCYLCERTSMDVASKLFLAIERGRLTNGREKVQSLSLPSIAGKVVEVYTNILEK